MNLLGGRSSLNVTNKIISLVKSDAKLMKLAKETFKGNSTLRTEVNALIYQLSKGNLNPGIGTKSIGKSIFEQDQEEEQEFISEIVMKELKFWVIHIRVISKR